MVVLENAVCWWLGPALQYSVKIIPEPTAERLVEVGEVVVCEDAAIEPETHIFKTAIRAVKERTAGYSKELDRRFWY